MREWEGPHVASAFDGCSIGLAGTWLVHLTVVPCLKNKTFSTLRYLVSILRQLDVFRGQIFKEGINLAQIFHISLLILDEGGMQIIS